MPRNHLKYIIVIFLLVFSIYGCSNKNNKSRINPGAEKLAKKVVKTLKNKDAEAYLKLCATTKDYIEVIKTLSLSKKEKKNEIDKIKKDKAQIEALEKDRRKNFKKISSYPGWDKAITDKVIGSNRMEGIGLKSYRAVVVTFKEQSMPYLKIDMVLKTSRGWKIFDDYALSFKE